MDTSVKIMLSYDYCHFEIALSESDLTTAGVDDLRKDAQRLADKAVSQYKIAKKAANTLAATKAGIERLKRDVEIIKENFPKSEWTPEQKAKVKALADAQYRARFEYDYQDDWDDGGYEASRDEGIPF